MSFASNKVIRWALVASAATLLAACEPTQQRPGQFPPPLVSTIKVDPQKAVISADLPGRVNPVRDAEVRARVTGIVKRVLFHQGGDVKAGDLLFEIDPAPYEAAFKAAQADLERAQADARAANLLARRYEPLVKINAVSRQEYDDAVARAQQAQASVLAAQAALESARINLDYTRVTAPIDGRIGQALVTEGALVEASTATRMALVQQLNPVYIDVHQSTAQLSRLRQAFRDGQLVQVAQDAAQVKVVLEDGSIYAESARLLFTGVTVDPGTGQVVLRTEVNNPDDVLLPGMFVRVRVEQGIDDRALAVPPQAIQRGANGLNNLFVVRDGAALMIPVKTGNSYQGNILITEGLKPGDEVIVEGFQKIRPGAPVTTRPWQNPA